MMSKRELSSTLKNLKFMQRASQRENDKEKEVALTPTGDFPSSSAIKRCVVIYEGDPHPGVARGRMSFLSFNPSIDKLDDEKCDASKPESMATNSGRKMETTSISENGLSEDGTNNMKSHTSSNEESAGLKRKQADFAMEALYPNKSKRTAEGSHYPSPNSGHSSRKQHKHENLDWNVLQPCKYQSKRRQVL